MFLHLSVSPPPPGRHRPSPPQETHPGKDHCNAFLFLQYLLLSLFVNFNEVFRIGIFISGCDQNTRKYMYTITNLFHVLRKYIVVRNKLNFTEWQSEAREKLATKILLGRPLQDISRVVVLTKILDLEPSSLLTNKETTA